MLDTTRKDIIATSTHWKGAWTPAESTISRSMWGGTFITLPPIFGASTAAGMDASTDALIQFVGNVLGAVYSAPGCALIALDDSKSWALAARVGEDLVWLRGSREEMLASVPDNHFSHAIAKVNPSSTRT